MNPKPKATPRAYYRKGLVLGLILLLLSTTICLALAKGLTKWDKSVQAYDTEVRGCTERWPSEGGFWTKTGHWFARVGCKAWANIKNLWEWITAYLFDKLKEFLRGLLVKFLERMIEVLIDMITGLTPNLKAPGYAWISGVHKTIFTILIPFYAFNLIIIGIYFLFTSVEPSKRARAKSMFESVLVSMVLVSVSPVIYQTLVSAADRLSTQMMGMVMNDIAIPGGSCASSPAAFFSKFMGSALVVTIANPATGFVLTFGLIIFLLFVFLFLMIRFALILIFYIIFPFTLFCYFFEYTRNLGGDLLSRSLMWILVGPVMALMVSITVFIGVQLVNTSLGCDGTVTAVTGFSANPVAGVPMAQRPVMDEDSASFILLFMLLGGFLGILVVPLLMTGLMKWVGAGVAAAGMNRMANAEGRSERWKAFGMVAAGNYMVGQGSRSLVSAGIQAAWARPDAMNFRDRGQDMLPSSLGGAWSDMKGVGSWATGLGRTGGGAAGFTRRAFSPVSGLMDFGRNLTGAFSGFQRKRDDAMGEFNRMVGFEGKEYAGSVYNRGGGGGGAAGKRVGTVKTGEGPPTSPLAGAPPGTSVMIGSDGKPVTLGSNRYSKGLDMGLSMGSRESLAWLLPMLDVFNRFDDIVRGSRRMVSGSSMVKGSKGGGRSMGVSEMGTGLGKIAFAFRPISIFFPLRIAGLMLYNIAPELVPPGILQKNAMWLGRSVAGWGFRSIHDATIQKGRLRMLEHRFNNASNTGEMERYGREYTALMDQIGIHGNPITGQTNHDFYVRELENLRSGDGKFLSANSKLFDFYMENSGSVEHGSVDKVKKNVDDLLKAAKGSRDLAEFKSKFDKDKHTLAMAGLSYSRGWDAKSPDDITEGQLNELKGLNAGSMSEDDVRKVVAGWNAHMTGYDSLADKREFLSGLGGGSVERGERALIDIRDFRGERMVMARQSLELKGNELETALANEVYMSNYLIQDLMRHGYSEEAAIAKVGMPNVKLWKSRSGRVWINRNQLAYLKKKAAWDNPKFEEWMADRQGAGFKTCGRVKYTHHYDEKLGDLKSRKSDGTEGFDELEYEGIFVQRLTEEEKGGRVPVLFTDAAGVKHRVNVIGNQSNVIEGDRVILVKGTNGKYYHFGQWSAADRRGVVHEFYASDFSSRDSITEDKAAYKASRGGSELKQTYIANKQAAGDTRSEGEIGSEFDEGKREYEKFAKNHYFRRDDVSDLQKVRLTQEQQKKVYDGVAGLVDSNRGFFGSKLEIGDRESEANYRARLRGLSLGDAEIEGCVVLSKLGDVYKSKDVGGDAEKVAGYYLYKGVLKSTGVDARELGIFGLNSADIDQINSTPWSEAQIFGMLNSAADSVDKVNAGLGPADKVRLLGVKTYYNPDDANPVVVRTEKGGVFLQVNGAYLERVGGDMGEFKKHLENDIIPHEVAHEYVERRFDKIEADVKSGMTADELAGYDRARKTAGFAEAVKETVANARKLEGRDMDAFKRSMGTTLETIYNQYSAMDGWHSSHMYNAAQLAVAAENSGHNAWANNYDRMMEDKFGVNSRTYKDYTRAKGIFRRVYAQTETA